MLQFCAPLATCCAVSGRDGTETVIGFSSSGKHALYGFVNAGFLLQPMANFTPVSFRTIFFLVFSISYHYIIYLFISFLIFILLSLIYYYYYYYFPMLKGFGNLPTALDNDGGSRVSRPTPAGFYITRARKPNLIALSRPRSAHNICNIFIIIIMLRICVVGS